VRESSNNGRAYKYALTQVTLPEVEEPAVHVFGLVTVIIPLADPDAQVVPEY
jgi:hypothetical protein